MFALKCSKWCHCRQQVGRAARWKSSTGWGAESSLAWCSLSMWRHTRKFWEKMLGVHDPFPVSSIWIVSLHYSFCSALSWPMSATVHWSGCVRASVLGFPQGSSCEPHYPNSSRLAWKVNCFIFICLNPFSVFYLALNWGSEHKWAVTEFPEILTSETLGSWLYAYERMITVSKRNEVWISW
jgi:hypothetical protein